MNRIYPPTVQQMRLFEAVARYGSMTRAAEEVRLSQPTVSMQIRALEEKVGLKLIEKVGKSLALTRQGEVVRDASVDILSRLSEMEFALQNIQKEVAGKLSISVVSTAKYFLPQLLGRFKRRFPNVVPALEITNRENLVARMNEGRDDIYIMGRAPEDSPLISEPFLENIIVWVAPAKHPLAQQKQIPLQVIAAQNVIGREPGSGTRKAVTATFEAAGVQFDAHMEFDDSEAIKQAVASELGVAYLSYHALRLEIAAGELVILDVESFPLHRQWFAVHDRNERLSFTARAFLDFLLNESPDPAQK